MMNDEDMMNLVDEQMSKIDREALLRTANGLLDSLEGSKQVKVLQRDKCIRMICFCLMTNHLIAIRDFADQMYKGGDK